MGRARTTGIRLWDQVTLRLPPGMRDQINEIAAKSGRSANAEIVARLEQSLSPTESPDVAAIQELFQQELAKAVQQILAAK